MCPECVEKAEKGPWQSHMCTGRSSEGMGTGTAWVFRTAQGQAFTLLKGGCEVVDRFSKSSKQ